MGSFPESLVAMGTRDPVLAKEMKVINLELGFGKALKSAFLSVLFYFLFFFLFLSFESTFNTLDTNSLSRYVIFKYCLSVVAHCFSSF